MFPVMPDLFRHPPGGRRQVSEWTPEQVRGDGPSQAEPFDKLRAGLFQHPSRGRRPAAIWTPKQVQGDGSPLTNPSKICTQIAFVKNRSLKERLSEPFHMKRNLHTQSRNNIPIIKFESDVFWILPDSQPPTRRRERAWEAPPRIFRCGAAFTPAMGFATAAQRWRVLWSAGAYERDKLAHFGLDRDRRDLPAAAGVRRAFRAGAECVDR